MMRGFSLIELLVVIAIIGVLAAIAIPAYNRYTFIASITPMYQMAAARAEQALRVHATTGSFPVSTTVSSFNFVYKGETVGVLGGDSYSGWNNGTGVYGNSTCAGKMGLMDFTFYGSTFGNAAQSNTSHISFWLSNKNGVVKANCTITIYTTDTALRNITFPNCENTGGNVWSTTNTPLTNASMAGSTCN